MKNFADKKPELNVPRYPENLIKNVEKEVFNRVFYLMLILTVVEFSIIKIVKLVKKILVNCLLKFN